MAGGGRVVTEMEDVRAHGEWDKEMTEVEDEVVLDLEVFTAMSKRIPPLRVSGESGLVTLEELGVVDCKGSDCCNLHGLEQWSRQSAC